MRKQLLLLVAATASLLLIALVVPLAVLLREQAEDRAVAAATLEAQSLAPVVGTLGHAGQEEAVRLTVERLDNEPDRAVSVFLPSGRMLGNSAPGGKPVRLAATGKAFSTDVAEGRAVLVAVQGLPAGSAVVRVVVAEPAMHRGVTQAWLILGVLAVVLLGVGLLVADRLGRSLVGSVGKVAATADRLSAGDLTARLAPDGPPEVRTVGAELNRLAGRVSDLVQAEREDVADLSHRLRTPVTALRLDVDSLHAPEEAARLSADVDELERTVDEVIAAARRTARERSGETSDLVAVTQCRADYWRPLAEDHGRLLSYDGPIGAIPVAVAEEDLHAVIDALVGNVFEHTEENTDVGLIVRTAEDGRAELVVADAGQGMPSDMAPVRGHSESGSTGLGLDIVRRTAESSGGHIEIGGPDGGGTRIIVRFGRA
jgi:signal transduction histidine kinase